MLRKKNGVYDKNGEFTPVSWDEAFDIMAQKWKQALAAGGPDAIAMFGSGQWTIWEGYAAAKLFKRSEEHTSELQSLMRISYAVYCLNKKKQKQDTNTKR